MKIKFIHFLLIIFSSMAIFIQAQTGVGKLAGKVIDADTKEPLIGANVVILGTQLGGATDLNGEYFILNITPGTYEVKFSYVGYAPKNVQNVRIVAGITYELNVELSTDFTLPEIVVESKKFFEEKSTNTVKVIDADQISRLPVRGVSNIVALQSGVVIQEGSGGQSGNATINVRGGRGSEVLYIIDGIPQNNLYNRSSSAQVSNIAIDQISFQVGGYEAKYGQAQSGIINVTTKSGQSNYNILTDVVTSSFTDDFGYNLYSGSISGPVFPGLTNHTIFLSLERGWYKDANPPAISIDFKTLNKSFNYRPDNPAATWRYSAKTNSRMGNFLLTLGIIGNERTAKIWEYRSAKNSSRFNDEFNEANYSLSARLSQTVSKNTFWNMTFGYRTYNFNRYNPFFKDNLESYGDSTKWANLFGVTLLGNGQRTANTDENGVFRPYGWSRGLYQKRDNTGFFGDFDITSQIENHLVEFGLGLSYTTVRGYGIFPQQLLTQPANLTDEEKYKRLQPFVYGYDVTGKKLTNDDEPNIFLRPYKPAIGYAYLQDRFELSDLVLNIGVRLDYFDIKSYILKDPSLPYAGGSDPSGFDPDDFYKRKAEVEVSPRIGIGYPVTSSTVFHAQYGRFIQLPELNDVYFGPFDYEDWLSMAPQSGFNGALKSEETIQYEVGFRQLLGSNAALNITAFYKNIKGLVNVQNHKFRRTPGGELIDAIYPENSDFGTTKGLALSFDVTRLSYFSISAQYTYQIAEGTGSSTSSSQTAVFRNQDNAPPKVIAPLNFDQRHTAVVNVDFFIPEGQGGFLELFNINTLFSFNSGRPYTPTDKWNLLGDNGIISENTGYINSAYGPGSFRIDLKVEKGIRIDNLILSPYIWIENLLDADNVINVYRSTGSPYTTGWLLTPEGRTTAQQRGQGYVEDYMALERNPANFGIPRLIKLGFKLNFSNIGL